MVPAAPSRPTAPGNSPECVPGREAAGRGPAVSLCAGFRRHTDGAYQGGPGCTHGGGGWWVPGDVGRGRAQWHSQVWEQAEGQGHAAGMCNGNCLFPADGKLRVAGGCPRAPAVRRVWPPTHTSVTSQLCAWQCSARRGTSPPNTGLQVLSGARSGHLQHCAMLTPPCPPHGGHHLLLLCLFPPAWLWAQHLQSQPCSTSELWRSQRLWLHGEALGLAVAFPQSRCRVGRRRLGCPLPLQAWLLVSPLSGFLASGKFGAQAGRGGSRL